VSIGVSLVKNQFGNRKVLTKGGELMDFLFFYGTPIIAIFFFVNCVSLTKKIKNGDENTAINTIFGAIMFSFIIFSLIGSSFLN